MKEKWNKFTSAVCDSSWKVKLSAVVMGGGQLLYGSYFKGIIYFLLEIGIIIYMILRGVEDIRGFFTLGTQKGDAWLGIVGDNSVIMLLMGIFAWVVVAAFLYLYQLNIKDAYQMQKAFEAGKRPLSFKEELAQLLDKKFYITVLPMPLA